MPYHPLHAKRLDEIIEDGHYCIRGATDDDDTDPCDFDIPRNAEDKVPVNVYLLRRWRRIFTGLSLYHRVSVGSIERKATLHGYSIYSHKMGYDALQSYKGIITKIFDNDPGIHEKLDRVNCDIKLQYTDGDRTTFSMSDQESMRIGQLASVICVPKDKFVTVLVCYSLLTYPALSGNYPDMLENINSFETRQDFRQESMTI